MKLTFLMETRTLSGIGEELGPSAPGDRFGEEDIKWKPVGHFEWEGPVEKTLNQKQELTADDVFEIAVIIHSFLDRIKNDPEVLKSFTDRFCPIKSQGFDPIIFGEPPSTNASTNNKASTKVSNRPPTYAEVKQEKIAEQYANLPFTITRDPETRQWVWDKFPFLIKEYYFRGNRKSSEFCTNIKMKIKIEGVSLVGMKNVREALQENNSKLLRLTERRDVTTQKLIPWPFFTCEEENNVVFDRSTCCDAQWKTIKDFIVNRGVGTSQEFFHELCIVLSDPFVRDELQKAIDRSKAKNPEQYAGTRRSASNGASYGRSDCDIEWSRTDTPMNSRMKSHNNSDNSATPASVPLGKIKLDADDIKNLKEQFARERSSMAQGQRT